MKPSVIYYTILCLSAVLLLSCNGKTTATEPSSDPTVSSLTLAANDSFPGLSKAVFTIEERTDTGLIYNVDSLLYGTRIDSVIPSFKFNHTPASATIYLPTDTISLTGTDTINFSARPVLLLVIAEDLTTRKWYKIEVNVHQVDPDLYDWECIADYVYPTDGAEQKLVILQDKLYVYVNYGIKNRIFTSVDGKIWEEQTVTGLPDNCKVRKMLCGQDCLWYAEDSVLYTSSDGVTWNTTDLSAESFNLKNMLFVFNDSIWAIAKEKKEDTYFLATSKDGVVWIRHDDLPSNFPTSDYAATTFLSASGRQRAMVIGGFSASGEILNTRWNVEYVPNRGYTWLNFSVTGLDFEQLTGGALIAYSDRFFLFGGADKDNKIGNYALLESLDEGIIWTVPDSAHNMLPETYQLRTKASVAVDSKHNIYIVGGQSRTEVFSDVYCGRLNSINW